MNSQQNGFFGDDMFNECPTEQLDGREFSDQGRFMNLNLSKWVGQTKTLCHGPAVSDQLSACPKQSIDIP